MRIVHTADWHLGDRLGRIDRTQDLRDRVEEIAGICEEHRADVLLIAGDLFSELARPDGLRDAVGHLQKTFTPFLHRGGTILAVTGNHDNENFCQTIWHAMSLAAPAQDSAKCRASRGRLHLATEPTWLMLRNPSDSFDVGFVLIPYPWPGRYLNPNVRYRDFTEKNRLLSKAVSREIVLLTKQANQKCHGPRILMAHLTLRTDRDLPRFRVAAEEDIAIPLSDVPKDYAYVALGHIHVPTEFEEYIRYSGSIDRLDLGERTDRKGVVIFDVQEEGLKESPRFIPLDATPIYEVAIADPDEELPTLAERFPNADRDLVKLMIRYRSGRDSLEEILRQVDKVFPRWYAREWRDVGELGPEIGATSETPARFRDIVLEYLKGELIHHEDSEREAILARAERLLAKLEGGPVAP